MECLMTIATARGLPRDETVRRLLHQHISTQLAGTEEERLTHISTVLRFPPPPPGRRRPDGRVRLAVRLDEGVAGRAGALSLRLPGQAASRGFRDYGARPLTDAVVTAIARVKPFVDEGLEGLPPLLTQRQALGLWRLTVAATLTRAEQRVLYGPEVDGELSIVLREEDVAWHSPWRFQVALHLARQLLTGASEKAGLEMITAQTSEFQTLVWDLERTDDFDDHSLLRGLADPEHDVQGRGGTAVWRARRTTAMTSVGEWITTPGGPRTCHVVTPGWKLTMPPNWRGYHLRFPAEVPPTRMADLEAGRVVRVDAGSKLVLWPYGPKGVPIPGFESVLAGAGNIGAAELVELVLLEREHPFTYPRVPATTAHELGFISSVQRDDLIADAAAETRLSMAAALHRAKRLSHEEQQALKRATANPEHFARLAARSGIRFHVTQPAWIWHIGSVADAMTKGISGARLEWLAGASRTIRTYALESDMEGAWHQAFWLGRTYLDERT